MTTQKHRASFSGEISFVVAAAVAVVGCFGHPSTNVATMTCQQDVDCLSGYTCRVKGVPGGCCKPDDVNCGRLQDGATPTDGARSNTDSLASDGPSGSDGDARLGTGGAGGTVTSDGSSGTGGTTSTVDASSGTGGATSAPDAPALSDAPDAPATLPNASPSGSPCTSNDQCSNSLCVDGHCCDGKCDGNCESCVTGTCSFTSTPRKACNGSGLCAGACDKANTKVCTYPDSTTVCKGQTCANGQRTNKSLCDGLGNCPSQTPTTCDTNQCLADNSDCSGTCTAVSCGAGKYCTGSTCAPLKSQGDTCVDKSECGTGNCVDGYCCESACTGTCTSCAVTHGKCTNTTSPRTGKTCGGTAPCNASCTGSSADCVPASTTTLCGSPSCLSSTQLQLAGTCNSQGTCSQSTQTCTLCLSSTNACADCTPGIDRKCIAGGGPQKCDASGHWVNDTACGTGQVCTGAGSCACANTNDSCGTGTSCQSCTSQGKTCSAGSCVCPTSKPNACGSGCTNFSTDSSNCGGCNRPCATANGESCSGGQCLCTASAPPKPTLNGASVTTACVGGTAILSVSPSSGYTYQWFRQDGSPLSEGGDYTGTKTATLSFRNVTTSVGNDKYYCKITGTACAGSTPSDSFSLTINLPPTLTPSTLDDQSFTFIPGAYIGMLLWSVKAQGGTSSSYSFAWYQNDAPTSLYTAMDGSDTGRLEDVKSCSCAGSWYLEVTDEGNRCKARTPVSTLTVSCPNGGTCNAGGSCP